MKSMKIEELDRKILKVLNRDARMSFRLIAKELRISPTTLYYKVKKLERSGVLTDSCLMIQGVNRVEEKTG
ncbi:hypothetical protein LCGC14_0605420 [marine sediment metagenome]|uniref:HTH asnC-type domain-containing protein n=1 Tax=marine sediment metagenome TaxID=412755 RepID=A0A0F9RE29_9ZZZZ|nr:Lrp/AsnC family transcriptional regulator [Candidatus Aminicenantes bacterium]HEB36471.1 Lrp/AsnC family transcriptional regulator [Candidatus Aminicenantes bacterium]